MFYNIPIISHPNYDPKGGSMSPHPIVHIELSSKNLEESGKFYANVFDWQVEHIPAMNYATFMAEPGPGGGFNPIENMPAGSTMIYIGTDDIDASLAKVVANGGKTIRLKDEIPGFGWFATFEDPTGNVVGLYTALPRTS
jgi:hypothetical protein